MCGISHSTNYQAKLSVSAASLFGDLFALSGAVVDFL